MNLSEFCRQDWMYRYYAEEKKLKFYSEETNVHYKFRVKVNFLLVLSLSFGGVLNMGGTISAIF